MGLRAGGRLSSAATESPAAAAGAPSMPIRSLVLARTLCRVRAHTSRAGPWTEFAAAGARGIARVFGELREPVCREFLTYWHLCMYTGPLPPSHSRLELTRGEFHVTTMTTTRLEFPRARCLLRRSSVRLYLGEALGPLSDASACGCFRLAVLHPNALLQRAAQICGADSHHLDHNSTLCALVWKRASQL